MNHRSCCEENKELRQAIRELEQRLEGARELESVNRELTDFAHIISHDLKAPLAAISSIVEVLQLEHSDRLDHDGRELLQLLADRSSRLQTLIEGVLQYSRAGRSTEDRLSVNLNNLVDDILKMIAPPPQIAISVQSSLPVLYCQKTRIQQVFLNLLSNAVKFMDKPDGRIDVTCTAENGYWKFAIADNGRGIAENFTPRIFQLFASSNTPGNGTGTGIGLAVVKKIVELYGGRIWVESTAGKGSTFYFTYPQQAAPR